MLLLTITSVSLLTKLALCDTSESTPGEVDKDPKDSYDYVIVGAGSGGSVVANRLAAKNKYSVLLLEAGGDMTDDLYVPFNAPFAANVNNSWMYETDPQKFAMFSFPGHIGPITQGKVLGGTSSLNSMNYVRGNKEDFNKWATYYNATGWDYNTVLPYFREIEKFGVPDAEINRTYHGFDGETPVKYPSHYTKLSNVFLNACSEAGYEYIDYNGEKQSGYSRVQSNTDRGIRMAASTCFLTKYHMRFPKLDISMHSIVTKILIKNKTAIGVQFTKNGENKTVMANREVVVCAGTIGSAKLLMLSGIGPDWHLQNKSIPVEENLPVGQGLQDHVVFLGLVVKTDEDLIGLKNINSSIEQYRYNQTGLLTIPGGFEALLFFHSGVGEVKPEHPDLELELASIFPGPEIARSPYVSPEIYQSYYEPMFNYTGFMLALAMVQPDARGAVYLRSNNPDDKPCINPQMLRGTHDIDRIVNGTLMLKEKLLAQQSMRKIGAELWDKKFPSCSKFEIWTRDYVACLVSHTAFPGQHVCCTCAMGTHEKAVVDHELRVRGILNLRVADSSVMPQIISGNTHATTMMIGAKAAKMILESAEKANGVQSRSGLP